MDSLAVSIEIYRKSMKIRRTSTIGLMKNGRIRQNIHCLDLQGGPACSRVLKYKIERTFHFDTRPTLDNMFKMKAQI